jgi:hypothetical protein
MPSRPLWPSSSEIRTLRDCEQGRLPHGTEGKRQLCFNTVVLDLHLYLPHLFSMVGRTYGPAEMAKCLPLFMLAMQGIRPTEQDILKALIAAGVFPSGRK